MEYDHNKFRSILFSALTNAISENSDLIRQFEEEHRTSAASGISAISYDILPWQPFVGLSFRTPGAEADRYEPGCWRGAELIGEKNAEESLAPVLKYIAATYGALCKGGKGQEANHLIYLAAAEALLDPRVAKLLKKLKVPASVIEDRIPYREFAYFEYIVVDEDRVFKANYCETICAWRMARRLLGKKAF